MNPVAENGTSSERIFGIHATVEKEGTNHNLLAVGYSTAHGLSIGFVKDGGSIVGSQGLKLSEQEENDIKTALLTHMGNSLLDENDKASIEALASGLSDTTIELRDKIAALECLVLGIAPGEETRQARLHHARQVLGANQG